MPKIVITRETELGYGFTTCPGTEPTAPIWTGVYYSVCMQLSEDANWRSLRSVDKEAAWFVETETGWRRIVKESDMYNLTVRTPSWYDREYVADAVEVETE